MFRFPTYSLPPFVCALSLSNNAEQLQHASPLCTDARAGRHFPRAKVVDPQVQRQEQPVPYGGAQGGEKKENTRNVLKESLGVLLGKVPSGGMRES